MKLPVLLQTYEKSMLTLEKDLIEKDNIIEGWMLQKRNLLTKAFS